MAQHQMLKGAQSGLAELGCEMLLHRRRVVSTAWYGCKVLFTQRSG